LNAFGDSLGIKSDPFEDLGIASVRKERIGIAEP
jgi:hypothetical protein